MEKNYWQKCYRDIIIESIKNVYSVKFYDSDSEKDL